MTSVILAAAGLLWACQDSTAPRVDRSLNQPSQRKTAFRSGFNCYVSGFSEAHDVNAADLIIGQSVADESEGFRSVGFLCDSKRGIIINLSTLGGTSTSANGINARGDVVGWSETSTEAWHAFLWRKGVITDLGTLPGTIFSAAEAINEAGSVVGRSGNHAVLWKNGVITDLGTLPDMTWSLAYGINEAGQVVGASGTGYFSGECGPGYLDTEPHAVLWQDGKLIPLGTLGGVESVAFDINARGQIAGAAQTATGDWHAVIWEQGTPTDLGPGCAFGINNAGVAVGTSDFAAVYWRNGVKVVLQPVDPEIPEWYYANAISESGVVVGWAAQEQAEYPMAWSIR